jgi:hypothetical protein
MSHSQTKNVERRLNQLTNYWAESIYHQESARVRCILICASNRLMTKRNTFLCFYQISERTDSWLWCRRAFLAPFPLGPKCRDIKLDCCVDHFAHLHLYYCPSSDVKWLGGPRAHNEREKVICILIPLYSRVGSVSWPEQNQPSVQMTHFNCRTNERNNRNLEY